MSWKNSSLYAEPSCCNTISCVSCLQYSYCLPLPLAKSMIMVFHKQLKNVVIHKYRWNQQSFLKKNLHQTNLLGGTEWFSRISLYSHQWGGMGNRADIISFSAPKLSINTLFGKLLFCKGPSTQHRRNVGIFILNDWKKCNCEVKDVEGGNKEIKQYLSPVHFYLQTLNEEPMGGCLTEINFKYRTLQWN